ncbi:MAG: hypothetical protein MUE60_12310, partial [Candidatus Eisenbacteria bacterium]|nr:hypothetical protein [Candidatus Eisenbacteria bacterium]
LDHDHTRAWLRAEHYFPGPAVERRAEPPPESEAGGALGRARQVAHRHLAGPIQPVLPPETRARVVGIMAEEFARHGCSLPSLPGL